MIIPLFFIAAISWYLHRAGILAVLAAAPWLACVWALTAAMAVTQIVLSWKQTAFTTDDWQDGILRRLNVTVIIPCYNEDAAVVDRVIVALEQQTRLPGRIIVVDDGSSVDYAELRAYWERNCAIPFTWVTHEVNLGKKHAQATAIALDRAADIIATIDSDSALVANAIEEGLKPFASAAVVSVAGLESAFNFGKNILTRAVAARSLCFQLFAMSAQSVAGGSTLINPGAFSLYRAWLLRRVMPAYLGETFLGVPVTLGDDTALTTFALMHGKAVHQPSAVALNMYPDTLSQHLRQWRRWMRASTIRTFWRLRYLPLRSWGWVYTLYSTWGFLNSVAVTAVIILGWPVTWRLGAAVLIASLAWPWLLAVRLATVKRGDMRTRDTFAALGLLPVAALWFLLVLRQIRFYGMATCDRQGWVTRQDGAEVTLSGIEEEPVYA